MIKTVDWICYIGSRISLALRALLSWILEQSHNFFRKNMLHKSLEKDSTFFPKDWSANKIQQKLREAYKDGILNPQKQTKTTVLLGHTSEGIPIRFWFKTEKRSKIVNGKRTVEVTLMRA